MNLEELHWYPKPFSPGDMDGEGSKKLLGQPSSDWMNIVVRETAQNSWDARLPGHVPEFDVRFRTLDPETRDILRRTVFPAAAPEQDLSQFDTVPLKALEIDDRGTKGLGGTIRNDVARATDESTDFADFVLNVGAPRDTQHGGGTYGFGKTAAYGASASGTIVIWTRTREPNGRLGYRFIASAMGSAFDDARGRRYTGRQWWGAAPDPRDVGFVVKPVMGEPARQLGETLFERHFEGDETGTSLLVIAPRLGHGPTAGGLGAEAEEDPVTACGKALVRNLWPKMIPEQPRDRSMIVRLFNDGSERELPMGSRILEANMDCLQALRAVQSADTRGNPVQEVDRVLVHEIKVWQKIVGHLALMQVMTGTKEDPWSELAASVTLMRHDAELVVKNARYPAMPDESITWVGVFRPRLAFDDSYALAEPPAHDEWNWQALQSPHKTYVKRTLELIRDHVKKYVTPQAQPVDAGEAASTGTLSQALSALSGFVAGTSATPTRRSSGGGRRGIRLDPPRVRLVSVEPLRQSLELIRVGRQQSYLELALKDPKDAAVVTLDRLEVAIDGASVRAGDEVVMDGWLEKDGSVSTEESRMVHPGDVVTAVISYPEGVAVDFSFKAVRP